MKRINVVLMTIAIILSTACNKKPNKDLIVGKWEISSVKPLKSTETDDKMTDDIQRYINNFDFNSIYFGSDKRFKSFHGSVEQEPNDIVEYRLINEKDFSDYPNFKIENENGNWIAFVSFERNGSLYNGTNIYSPVEIISLSKDKLCLMVHDKFHGLETILNKFLLNYKRVETNN